MSRERDQGRCGGCGRFSRRGGFVAGCGWCGGGYGRLDLLLIDEVGYVQLDTRDAELLFQVLTEREEKSSIGLASNLPFRRMGRHHR